MNNFLLLNELKKINYSIEKSIKYKNIYDIYPDFNWNFYKELNPYLYIIGLRTEEEYIKNYLLEGRYKGRIYKEIQKKNYSYHILLATIGKNTIFNILIMLKKQLLRTDFLTIVFDGKKKINNFILIKNFCKNFLCVVNIIIEEENLGYWGHGIRNKYNDLNGDFIYHIDDDDILYEDSFDIIRRHCVDINIIYIFKITLENNKIIWKNKIIKEGDISTQSGIIPIHINKDGYWTLRYGGDFDFYNNLSKKYNVIFIDKLIYRKIGAKFIKNKMLYL
jgi:hypothetical protein